MDFPEANFPNPSAQVTKRHEVFYEYGSHGFVDVQQRGQKNEAVCQKVPEGFLRKGDYLCAKRPTLPLSSSPENVDANNTCDLMKDVLKVQEEAANFKRLINHYSFEHDTLSENAKKRIRNYSLKRTRKQCKDLHLLQRLAEQYGKFRELSDIPKTNSEYAGGCISCLVGTSDETTDVRLVSAAGNNLSQLRISHVKIDQKELTLRLGQQDKLIEDWPVREVTARCVSGQEHIAARGLNSCRLYSNRREGRKFKSVAAATFTAEQGQPTSVCLSKYIPGECLVSTTTGAVYLWSSDQSPSVLIEDRPTRFLCTLPWRRAEFGAHPREVVAADPTVVQLFDVRRSPCKPGVDLFALPSSMVMTGERIYMFTQSAASEFHHFVATDYSFFLLDQRFPSTPVLNWKSILKNPPQYLEGVNFPSKGHSLLLIGSQGPPEVCCYTYKCSSGKAAQALGAPWRVSRIGDVFHHQSMCGGSEEVLTTDRFNTSLAGITTIPLDDDFFTIQLDSYGEIFYQGYQFSDEVHDKTCSVETDGHPWDDITIRKGHKWITRYVRKRKETQKDENKRKQSTDQNNCVYTNLSLKEEPNIHCPLCHPEQQQEERIEDNTDPCPSCHQTLTTAQQLVQAGQRVVGYKPDKIRYWEDRYKTAEELWQARNSGIHSEKPCSPIGEPEGNFPQTNALSKILVALWEEDSPDLSALLLERDEEIKQKRKEKKESQPKNSNRLLNEDQQFIRNLQLAADGGNQQGSSQRATAMSPSAMSKEDVNGYDSDASFHRLFGINTLREEDDLPEDASSSHSQAPQSAELDNILAKSQEYLESLTIQLTPRKRKRRSSRSSVGLFSECSNDGGSRQLTCEFGNFSPQSDRLIQESDNTSVDDFDHQFFSQDIAQSFTMFSGSISNVNTPQQDSQSSLQRTFNTSRSAKKLKMSDVGS
ncbi:uncharacterized protein [Argopecten irradians]|uniref:uncharacterized protein n=1 Tax=Argopecten irradians TaxID=31199 RepID=UPI003713AE8B